MRVLCSYSVLVHLENWKKDSKSVQPLMYTVRGKTVTVYTTQPGWYIGKAGCLIDKYIALFKQIFGDEVELKIVEANII